MSVRLFVSREELRAGPLEVRGDEHHYLSHVRRLVVGDGVMLFDGEGCRASAEIRAIGADRSELLVGEREVVPPPDFRLSVAPALIKGERMDLAITKMVELGVDSILPITTERTIVRLKGPRALSRHKRYESLAQAAARQSHNPHPARVSPISTFTSVLSSASEFELKLIPYAGGAAIPLEEALPAHPPQTALVLIGPEGGWAPAEVSAARSAEFIPVGLGSRVLRAETACIAIAAILAFRYGDVGRR